MKIIIALLLTAFAVPTQAAPSFGMASVAPMTAVIGTPTQVTVKASITDPTLIANSVKLVQLNADGTTTILGTLHDDGLKGDPNAGDLVFTLQVTLNSASASQVRLEVSAAFKGTLTRVKSQVMSVYFQAANAPQQALAALSQSLSSGDRTTALTYLNASANAVDSINNLDQAGLNLLATCASNAVLVSASVDSRIFQCPETTPNGTSNSEFDMVPGLNGQWVINSW